MALTPVAARSKPEIDGSLPLAGAVGVAGVAAVAVRPGSASRHRRPRRSSVVIGLGLALLVAAAAISAANVDTDAGSDLLGLASAVGVAALHLRWQFVVVVVLLAGGHYLATAVAARASAGVALPMTETLLVQLSAAAANRLTPAGLGGSALTARYFTRRGLRPSAAIGAVAALAVLGALADFLVLLVLVVLGRPLGLGGASHELSALTAKVTHTFASARSPWLWGGIVLAACLVGGARLFGRRGLSDHPFRQFCSPIVGLLRRPRALITLLAASGLTTLVLGFAFVASTAMVPGPRPTIALGALLVAFMLGSAAATSVPIPAGLGTTEAALIGVLVAAQVPAGHAVEVVMIFRLLTFWLPAVIGVLATRHLRRHGAI
jgi:uncharacterized membrane protein YbhN (UPF0104 family)